MQDARSLECLGTSICHFRLITIWMTKCEFVRVAISYFSCLAQDHRLFVCASWLFVTHLFCAYGTIGNFKLSPQERKTTLCVLGWNPADICFYSFIFYSFISKHHLSHIKKLKKVLLYRKCIKLCINAYLPSRRNLTHIKIKWMTHLITCSLWKGFFLSLSLLLPGSSWR